MGGAPNGKKKVGCLRFGVREELGGPGRGGWGRGEVIWGQKQGKEGSLGSGAVSLGAG